MAFDVIRLPTMTMAVATIAFALFVLYLRPNDRLHRALSLLLLARGGFYFFLSLDQDPSSWGHRYAVYYGLVIPFAALWFAWLFHVRFVARKAGGSNPTPAYRAILLAGAAGVALWYLVDHEMAVAGFSTWDLWLTLPYVAYGFLAWMLGREYNRAPPGNHRRALLLLSVGFGAEALFRAGRIMPQSLFNFRAIMAQVPETIWAYPLFSLALVFGCLAIWEVGRAGLRHPGLTAFWATMAAALLSGIGLYVLSQNVDRLVWSPIQFFVEALWLLLVVALAAYAVTRCELLGLEVRVKRIITGGTVAAPFALILFVVGESLEGWALQELGVSSYWVGLAAAGAIALLLFPLQRVARRLAERLFPGVDGSDAYLARRREQMYRAAVEDAVADRVITDRERMMLDSVREHLALSPQQAKGLEKAVLTSVLSALPG